MNPKECQGRAYHTPSAANPTQCYRCMQLIARNIMEQGSGAKYHNTAPGMEHPERYMGVPLNDLPTGDMGE